tara:strand:- start:2519 stop:3220 length:702 start_codon:yes stop_codon:yes gene_type:complete
MASCGVLGLCLVGCPKPKPPLVSVAPESPESTVVISGFSPSETTFGVGVTVHVQGSGFAPDSRVFLGELEMGGVDVIDDLELSFRAAEDLQVGRYDVSVRLADGSLARGSSAFTVQQAPGADADCTLQTVRFDFNEASLTAPSRETLAANAECLVAQAGLEVQLVGHADERGSTLYNLSLGQRRADSVRQFMINLGVETSRMTTLSYGEERPELRESSEEAWAVNRRVEFVLR